MAFKRGDHICVIYASVDELSQAVAGFLVDGLHRRERCWYVGAGPEMDAVREALAERGVDVAAQTSRGALQLIAGNEAYVVHGSFDPETTIKVFNDAIEHASRDGFAGFRAAAEMSWALDCIDGAHQVIVYEALLKPLFESARAIGICLYDRTRMPVDVINGALATHPVTASRGRYVANPYYEPEASGLVPVAAAEVEEKLAQLAPAVPSR